MMLLGCCDVAMILFDDLSLSLYLYIHMTVYRFVTRTIGNSLIGKVLVNLSTSSL